MLIPSRFEPCGLIQLHAMNNGTIPLATTTGGLSDTIKDGVTGFSMGGFNIDLMWAIGIYGTPAYIEMVQKCMVQDLSWMGPAQKWEEILSMLRAYCYKSRSGGEEEISSCQRKGGCPFDQFPLCSDRNKSTDLCEVANINWMSTECHYRFCLPLYVFERNLNVRLVEANIRS